MHRCRRLAQVLAQLTTERPLDLADGFYAQIDARVREAIDRLEARGHWPPTRPKPKIG